MESKNKCYPDLALCGRMRSGKDSIASYLIREFGYKKLSFAHALKTEVSKASGCTVEEMDVEPLRSQIRSVLQAWGTEFRRSQDPDYWVKKLEDRMVNDNVYLSPSVITDARFPNEIDMLRHYGFTVVHVNMDYEEVVDYLMSQGKRVEEAMDLLSHPSENEWQRVQFDVEVESIMGDLPGLFKQIQSIVELKYTHADLSY